MKLSRASNDGQQVFYWIRNSHGTPTVGQLTATAWASCAGQRGGLDNLVSTSIRSHICPDPGFTVDPDDLDGDGISNSDDAHPLDNDNDDDGISDGWELAYGLDPENPADATADTDLDQASNRVEYENGTNPLVADTDNDGIPDGWEIQTALSCNKTGLYPLNPVTPDASLDTDGDKLTNLQEYLDGTDPCIADMDNDGLLDGEEIALGSNPKNAFDPPLVRVRDSDFYGGYLLGIDDRNFQTSNQNPYVASPSVVYGSVWNASYGNYLLSGTGPRVTDLAVNDDDFCSIDGTGVMCLVWKFNIYGAQMPAMLSGQVPVANTTTGYLEVNGSRVFADSTRISGGHLHACLTSMSEGVYCWGMAISDGITGDNIPGDLRGNGNTVRDVATGEWHACALAKWGVKCWGDNSYGQLGPDANQDGYVDNSNGAVKIIAGGWHTCTLNNDKTVSCWGDNSHGQLGSTDPNGHVSGITNALDIAAGLYHTCAITGSYMIPSTLAVQCWGDNSLYQTSIPQSLLPYGVDHPVKISAGGNRTCVVVSGSNNSENAITCWPIGINVLSTSATDTDGDGWSDYEEVYLHSSDPQHVDTDGDGINDPQDNCPATYNPDQADMDNDGIGDVCDPDMDGDGIENDRDALPAIWGAYTGQLDKSHGNVTGFGDNGSGSVLANLPPQVGANWPAQAEAYAAALQSDGYIVVVGRYLDGVYDLTSSGLACGTYCPNYNSMVMRFKPDGQRDPNFGNNGLVSLDTSSDSWDEQLDAVAIDKHGNIVAAGRTCSHWTNAWTCADYDVLVVRLTSTGTRDQSFGSNGETIYVSNYGSDVANAIALEQNKSNPDADPKIIIAGRLVTGYPCGDGCIDANDLLIRFDTYGALDTSFGDGGIVSLDTTWASWDEQLNALAIQDDGKIVAAGRTCSYWTTYCTDYDVLVVRLDSQDGIHADGTRDANFGNNGQFVFQSSTGNDVANAIVIQPDGKIVVAGQYLDSASCGGSCTDFNNMFLRLDQYGVPDAGFGIRGTGLVSIDTNSSSWDEQLNTLIPFKDGMLAAGRTCVDWNYTNWSCNDYDMLWIMLSSDGTGSFYSYFPVVTGGSEVATTLLQQPVDKKVVLAGYVNDAGSDKPVLLRFFGENDTDGDGVIDTNDAYPLDPTRQ